MALMDHALTGYAMAKFDQTMENVIRQLAQQKKNVTIDITPETEKTIRVKMKKTAKGRAVITKPGGTGETRR